MWLKICYCATIVFVLSAWTDSVYAHEFDTNHIERSIDVVVRDRNVEVKYAIGLADETILNWLVREGKIALPDEVRIRKCIAEFEAGTGQGKGVESSDELAESNQQPLAFQTELVDLLKEQLSQSICDNLQAVVDEKELAFESVQINKSARHHVALEFVLKFKLPESGIAELSFVDRNFMETIDGAAEKKEQSTLDVDRELLGDENLRFRYSGNIRVACRAKGNAVLLSSNVAPVLVRAPVTNVGPLSEKQRVEVATIKTRVAFAETSGR